MSTIYYDSIPTTNAEKAEWYTVHRIPKRGGSYRVIEAPADWLKATQKEIYQNTLLRTCKVSSKAFGCIKNRNIRMAAALHVGKKFILKVDLSDCFHRINESMVTRYLVKNGLDEGISKQISYYCTNSKGVLPQGAPTSPSLANICMIDMYKALDNVSKAKGVDFSGYMDDLVFSTNEVGTLLWLKVKIEAIIETYGHRINTKKVVIMRNKREVLGACVADGKDHPRLPKHLRNDIRMFIHVLKKQKEAGKLDNELLNRTQGLVSWAHSVGDQKSAKFMAQMQEIRNGS